MKKNIISLLVFSMVNLLFISWGFGATRVYLPAAAELKSQLIQKQVAAAPDLTSSLGLGANADLKIITQRTDKKNVTRVRYNQLFKGIPIWGHHIIMAKTASGKISALHGTKVKDIALDIPKMPKFFSNAKSELSKMKARHIINSQHPGKPWLFKNEIHKKVIYIDQDGKARVC